MTDAELIWNRALVEKASSNLRSGDLALASLLSAHGLTMNGGVLHAVEILNGEELLAAKSGYLFFGFENIANLLSRAKDIFDANVDLESFERILDDEYADQIPHDAAIAERFELHLTANPGDFAPLGE